MSFPLLEEDGRTATFCEAICNLGHESSLTETVTPKNLARKLDAANPDYFVGYSFKRCLILFTPQERSLLIILTVWVVHWGDDPAFLTNKAGYPSGVSAKSETTKEGGLTWLLISVRTDPRLS
jgi:hypothetical protein